MLSNDIMKDMIDVYFRDLAKEFKRLTGRKAKAEIIVVGGASILLNYDFRMNSIDIDAFTNYKNIIECAAKKIADKYQLSQQWFNDDFTKTTSYSSKLRQYSIYYKTFGNVIEVRTIRREYLIAMKMMSGRKYKNDLSDILGILYQHYMEKDEITYNEIEQAIINLYGKLDEIDKEITEFVKNAIKNRSFIDGYNTQKQNEKNIRDALIQYQKENTNNKISNNVDNILDILNSHNN